MLRRGLARYHFYGRFGCLLPTIEGMIVRNLSRWVFGGKMKDVFLCQTIQVKPKQLQSS
jgi:hypothetical protein